MGSLRSPFKVPHSGDDVVAEIVSAGVTLLQVVWCIRKLALHTVTLLQGTTDIIWS